MLYRQNRKEITRILIDIYENVNDNQECFLDYGDDIFLFLKYVENNNKQKELTPVEDYEVPIPMMNLSTINSAILYNEGDLNLCKIINLIDGVNCVKKISVDTNIEISKVKDYIQNLLFHGLVKLVDIFHFANKYCLTKGIHDFITDETMKQECLKYVAKSNSDEDLVRVQKRDKKENLDSNDIVKLYLQIRKEQKIGDFLKENLAFASRINFTKFLHFGLFHKFIRRAHEFLVQSEKKSGYFLITVEAYEKYLKDKENSEKNLVKIEDKIKKINDELEKMISENACLDKICVNLEISKETIKELLQGKHIYIVSK